MKLKTYICFLIILFTSSLAEDAQNGNNSSDTSLPVKPPGLPNLPLPVRQKRHLVPQPHTENQERTFFFNHFGHHQPSSDNQSDSNDDSSGSTYDYESRPRSKCHSCHAVIIYLPRNRTYIRRCSFVFPYCNNGRCSLTPGAQCGRTTRQTTTTTTPITSSTTTADISTTSSSSSSASSSGSTPSSSSSTTSTAGSTASITSTTTSTGGNSLPTETTSSTTRGTSSTPIFN